MKDEPCKYLKIMKLGSGVTPEPIKRPSIVYLSDESGVLPVAYCVASVGKSECPKSKNALMITPHCWRIG